MMKRLMACVVVLTLVLAAAVPALAANVFMFTEKAVSVGEGELYPLELKRDGSYDGDGDIEYTSSNPAVATVDQNGVITGVAKGRTNVVAVLKRDGRKAAQAAAVVTVTRAVTKVTLNTTRLSVYQPDDPAVMEYLRDITDHQVLVVPAGGAASLAATCTPTDASNLKVTFTSSDEGVAKIAGSSLRAVQKGECDLVIQSVQNPEVTETFRVLVIQPVKKITIDAGGRKVAAGSSIQLTAYCTPDNATIRNVTWTSRAPQIASVDENGVVTGLKRGSVSIVATAADGTGVSAAVSLAVLQPVETITMTQPEVQVTTGKTAVARYTVQPADASDKTVSWTTSDSSIATVRSGQVTGVKAGTCYVTATSTSNPEVSATARVVVSQLVTKVENVNLPDELTIKVGETVQTKWRMQPDDATMTSLSFRTNAPKVATVDENGLVRGTGRGTTTITAQSNDAGRRQGYARVTVIQPVTGVSMQYPLYYVQRGGNRSIRAVVEPRNANNQKVIWSSEDESIATVRSNGTSTGSVHGISSGTTTITGYTEDGGFVASTQVRIGNFNSAVMVEELDVNANNQIKIVMRNTSRDLTMVNIYYTIECFDLEGEPLICNKDGKSTSFTGYYPHLLEPLCRTSHGAFRFKDYSYDQLLGSVTLTVTGWKDDNGVTWTIPQSERIHTQWYRRGPKKPEKKDKDKDKGNG